MKVLSFDKFIPAPFPINKYKMHSGLKYFLLILVFYYIGCQKSEYNLTNLYQGDKMVLNGFVSSDSGCIVNVTKSSPSTGNILYSKLKVDDARVFLYENGDSVLELKLDTLGRFSNLYFMPKIGSYYKIRASSLTLPECESEEVIFDEIQVSTKPEIQNTSNIGYGVPGVIFTFKFNFEASQAKYFVFNSTGDNKYVDTDFLQPEGVDKSCGRVLNYLGGYLVSSICYSSGDTLKIGVGTNNYSGKKISILNLNISSVSQVFYKYYSAKNDLLGSDFAFIEPSTLVTNIKGGYGIFYAKNTKSYTYKL